ncbi:MAG: T9SS type A sorting domain-containing protein [Flavobacteriales bacterium]|nr:T9SS type A sorting domain-containing protein [Flavobacteriales bacterium]
MILSLQLEAQNIVPNPSFEEITYCPTSGGAIFWASPWNRSMNSPDLYNVCGDNGYSVPVNVNGVQMPRRGEGYAGFATYVNYPSFVDAREFVKCPLKYPLVEGEDYYVEFYVSQCDSAEYATHNLGVTFTDVDTAEFGELLCWPNCEIYVENTSANPLTSKTDWVKVSGTFTAHGGERYIHIGNFRTDVNSEIEFIGGGVGPEYDWFVGAYYLDDVWLSHIDSAHYVGISPPTPRRWGMEVFPNPSMDGTITVKCELKGDDRAELRVFDMLGRTFPIQKGVSALCGQGEFPVSIDVSHWADGVYSVVLIVNGKAALTEKLVILKQ